MAVEAPTIVHTPLLAVEYAMRRTGAVNIHVLGPGDVESFGKCLFAWNSSRLASDVPGCNSSKLASRLQGLKLQPDKLDAS